MLYNRCWTRALVVLLLIWFGVLLYLLGPLWKISENEELLSRQLVEANGELVRLGTENNELRDLLKKVQGQLQQDKKQHSDSEKDILDSKIIDTHGNKIKTEESDELTQTVANVIDGPTKEYELARRRIFRDINELWWYIREKLERGLKTNNQELKVLLNRTLVETQHRHGSILSDLHELSEVDGFKSWREKEAKDLSDLIQKRLHALQNPEDCASARKLVCKLNKGIYN